MTTEIATIAPVSNIIQFTLPCVSAPLAKSDSRCRGWAVVIRDKTRLPAPEDVEGAADLDLPYARQSGTEELFGTDAILKGEENHHRRARGWSYWLVIRDPSTNEAHGFRPSAEIKALIKNAIVEGRCSMPVEYLKGSGDLAACVRILHAIRGGMTVAEIVGTDA